MMLTLSLATLVSLPLSSVRAILSAVLPCLLHTRVEKMSFIEAIAISIILFLVVLLEALFNLKFLEFII